MDEPETQVRLEVVEATMSSPMFRAEPDGRTTLPWSRRSSPRRRICLWRPPRSGSGSSWNSRSSRSLAVAASFFGGDARIAVVAGSLGLAAVGFRRIDRRVPFSFGEGFIGYRSDLGWPQGVQEDDDVHWNWARRAPDARDGAA